jgi:DNA repair exonuclease SbcCD ATPase subunit
MPATLHSIEQRFLARQTEHAMRQGQKLQLDRQIEKVRMERKQEQVRLELYQHAQELLLKASSTARALAQAKIEDLVTLALSGITGDPYRFKMDLVQSAGSWQVRFWVVAPSGAELDPIDQCGGGIADICSMALRVAILEMYEPRIDGPILLDENMKYLSRDHDRAAVEFFRMLSEKTGRQIILVTHVPELARGAERCFEVVPEGETSRVEDITSRPEES